jgi:hypothetical protein
MNAALTSLPLDGHTETQIQAKVAQAMAIASGIRLARDGQPLPEAERQAFLLLSFREVVRATSIDHLMSAPADLLENFAVMALQRRQSIEGELVQLIRLFLMAYADPETTADATRLVQGLESRLQEVIGARGPSFSKPFDPMPGAPAVQAVTTH